MIPQRQQEAYLAIVAMIRKEITPLPPALLLSAIIECDGGLPNLSRISHADSRIRGHVLGKFPKYYNIDNSVVLEGEKWWEVSGK